MLFPVFLIGFILIKPPIKDISLKVVDQELMDFSNLVGLAGLTALVLPKIKIKKKNNCNVDEDCIGIQRCCRVYSDTFCCSPNNFVYLEPKLAYSNKEIQN